MYLDLCLSVSVCVMFTQLMMTPYEFESKSNRFDIEIPITCFTHVCPAPCLFYNDDDDEDDGDADDDDDDHDDNELYFVDIWIFIIDP